MTSTDIILEAIIGLDGKIELISQRLSNVENLVTTEIRANEIAHTYLGHSIYWSFAAIGVVVALVGLKANALAKKS